MLTLFILSQWTKVYSKVSINLLRMLQNQLASVLQSRVLAARQAEVLLSAPLGLPWALPLPMILVFPSVCWDIKAGPAWRKRSKVPRASPHLLCPLGGAGMQPRAPGKAGSTESVWPASVSAIQTPSPRSLTSLLHGHAFGTVPLLRCFLLHITL